MNNQLPQIIDVKKSDLAVEFKLSFPGNLNYFDGHFPGTPILPGVAQIHCAILLAAEHLDIKPHLKEMKAVKFNHLIRPDIEICLRLEYSAHNHKLSYIYYDEDRKYSSGTIILND